MGLRGVLVFILGVVGSTGFLGLADVVQTASATLEDVITIIQEQENAAEKQLQLILSLVYAAVERGSITPDGVLSLLEAVGWEELRRGEDQGFAIRALELALAAVNLGEAAYDEILAALTEAMASEDLKPLVSLSPEVPALVGVMNSLAEKVVEPNPSLLATIAEAISAGLPPGQVVSTVKALRHKGASEEEIMASLKELLEEGHPGKGRGKPDQPPGKENAGNKKQGQGEKGKPSNPGQGKGKGKGKGKKG